MSQFISSSLLALTAAASVYATPLSTSSHYIPSTGANLAVAPLIEEHYPHGSLNNSYIVVFKNDSPGHLVDNHYNFLQTAQHSHPLDSSFTGGLRHLWDGNVKGYAGTFSDRVVEQIRRMPEVAFVERDQIVRTTKFETQKGAPWGLARISHRKKLTFGTFSKYEYDSDGGEGVNVYVVDTGINIEHEEFEGRAHWGKTIPQNDQDIDGNGHGTHCAGTIASKKYGVAKKANVIAVKVLGTNGSGSMSDVVAGVQWAATDAQKHAEAADAEFAATGKTNHKGSVANMSLGGGKSRALDIAVNAAVDTGLHFAVAAGNDNRDACNYSPAAAEKAITVGASDISDKRAYFSNHGPCVDVFGPGLNILSTYIGSKSAVATLSGTSMASPHVAGLAAYLLSIYGTESFDPKTGKKSMIPSALQVERIASTSVYGAVHRALPGFVTQYMPSPQLVATFTAPIPKRPVLSAEELKTGVLDLSTSGLLTDMPEKTINLLVFNNATSA